VSRGRTAEDGIAIAGDSDGAVEREGAQADVVAENGFSDLVDGVVGAEGEVAECQGDRGVDFEMENALVVGVGEEESWVLACITNIFGVDGMMGIAADLCIAGLDGAKEPGL